jgi:hypothetical protein
VHGRGRAYNTYRKLSNLKNFIDGNIEWKRQLVGREPLLTLGFEIFHVQSKAPLVGRALRSIIISEF